MHVSEPYATSQQHSALLESLQERGKWAAGRMGGQAGKHAGVQAGADCWICIMHLTGCLVGHMDQLGKSFNEEGTIGLHVAGSKWEGQAAPTGEGDLRMGAGHTREWSEAEGGERVEQTDGLLSSWAWPRTTRSRPPWHQCARRRHRPRAAQQRSRTGLSPPRRCRQMRWTIRGEGDEGGRGEEGRYNIGAQQDRKGCNAPASKRGKQGCCTRQRALPARSSSSAPGRR